MVKRSVSKKAVPQLKKAATKDPKGGLTAAGRAAFNKKDDSNLKPGVQAPADTPQKVKRKASFLRRHFANPRGPMVDENGQPTRLELSARAWGEPVPKTLAAAKKLAEKGTRLLEQFEKTKQKEVSSTMAKKKSAPRKTAASKTKNSLVGNINKRKKAGKSRSKKKSTISEKAYDDMQEGWQKK